MNKKQYTTPKYDVELFNIPNVATDLSTGTGWEDGDYEIGAPDDF